MGDIVIGVLAIAGSLLVLLAGIGVVHFPDLYSRMHAATKAGTVGIGLISIAGAFAVDNGASRILLAAIIIFITAPSAAHFIGRAAYRADGVDIRLDGTDDLGDELGEATKDYPERR